MRYLFAILISLLLGTGVYAQKNRPTVNPADLDFGTNLVTPQVPEKQVVEIRTHINKLRDAYERLGMEPELTRDKEVLTLVVPCADLFAANDTVLKASGKAKLDNLAKLLQYPTMYKIVVAVYSDDTGEPAYCDNLTSVRANAIDAYLASLAASMNMPTTNVIPYGMGQADPRVENNTIENRALNRRVEIHIIPEWEMINTAKAGKLNR